MPLNQNELMLIANGMAKVLALGMPEGPEPGDVMAVMEKLVGGTIRTFYKGDLEVQERAAKMFYENIVAGLRIRADEDIGDTEGTA